MYLREKILIIYLYRIVDNLHGTLLHFHLNIHQNSGLGCILWFGVIGWTANDSITLRYVTGMNFRYCNTSYGM